MATCKIFAAFRRRRELKKRMEEYWELRKSLYCSFTDRGGLQTTDKMDNAVDSSFFWAEHWMTLRYGEGWRGESDEPQRYELR